MDFSDIFSGDTWDALGSLGQVGGALVGGISGMQNARNARNDYAATKSSLDQLYGPTSPYAQQMRQQLERRDAAAGRRSQYGPREAELAAKLTQAQSGVLNSPQYANLIKGQNTSTLGSLLGALGYLTKGQQGQKQNPLVNAASKVNSLRNTYNNLSSLFGGAADTGTAADLGGAGSAFGNTLAESGAYAPDVFNTGGGIFGQSQDFMLSPFSATNTADPFGSFASSVGQTPGYLGLGGAGEFGGAGTALSGMGAGSLGGTVGGADTLGSLFGGTGFLPGYTGTAGAGGMFGGAGATGAAGAGEAGAGLGAAGAGALPFVTAMPFLAALYGFGSGILGKGDNGNPFTQSQDAMAQALYNNRDNIQSLGDLSRFGGGDVRQYVQQQGLNPNDMNSYDTAREQLQGQGGGGNFFGNFLSGDLYQNGE